MAPRIGFTGLLIAFVGTSLLGLASCAKDTEAPFTLSPSRLSIDSEIGELRTIPLSIYNGDQSRHTFTIHPSSPRLHAQETHVSIDGHSQKTLPLQVLCPDQTDVFQDEIAIESDGASSPKTVPITITCHPRLSGGLANLSLTITGLPPDELADVMISGPENTSLFLTDSSLQEDLPSGRYTLTVSPISLGGYQLKGAEEHLSFLLLDGDHLDLTVEYRFSEDADRSSLLIDTTGLPDAALATFTIAGPLHYAATFQAPLHLGNLRPGAYTIAPADFELSPPNQPTRQYQPTPQTHSFYLFPGQQRLIHLAFFDRLQVTSSTDHTPGSLRALIADSSPGDTILIPPDLRLLNFTGGPLSIPHTLTIEARDTAQLTTQGEHGLFTLQPDTHLTLQNLELLNAAGDDMPAITSAGQLHLNNVIIRGSRTETGPSALHSTGELVAHGLSLFDNQSQSGPGAISINAGHATFTDLIALDNQGTQGGFLFSHAETRIQSAIIGLNHAREGGAIYSQAPLHLFGVALWLNQAEGPDSFGGAILSESTLHITNSTFLDNRATFGTSLGIDRGDAFLAHTTIAPDLEQGLQSPVFLSSNASLTTRASIFSAGTTLLPSIDAMDGSNLTSLGYNLFENADLFPLSSTDHEFSAPPPYLPAVQHEGWPRAIPLADTHPGYQSVPPEACLDTYGSPLVIDQLNNPRPIDGPCDAGAHQSDFTASPELLDTPE